MCRNVILSAKRSLLVCIVVAFAWGSAFSGVGFSRRSSDSTRHRRLALLIGVSRYEDSSISDLHFAHRDALELAEVLAAGGFARDEVTVMTHESKPELAPAGAHIRRELRRLEKVSADAVVVLFSGHAFQLQDAKEIWLVPSDAKLPGNQKSMIGLSEVISALRTCKARLKLLLLDASGGHAEKVRGQEGVVVLMASQPGAPAFECPAVRHGAFSYAVIQGLRGGADYDHDGTITVPELELYVKRQTPRLSKAIFGVEQLPARIGDAPGLRAIVELPWKEPVLTRKTERPSLR